MSENKQLTEELAGRLKAQFGERLVSVCLYGSGARDIEHSKKSLNVLVILQGLSSEDLHAASTVSLWWEQKAHTLPVYLSEEEWTNASDVFALEYADIKDWHWVAYGKDLYSAIEVDCHSLRLICELEIYRKLLFLRQRILLLRNKPETLLTLMKDANGSFAAIFRGILRVYRPDQPLESKKENLFSKLSEVVPGFSKEPFIAAENCAQIDKTQILPTFERYVAQISLVNSFLNEASVK